MKTIAIALFVLTYAMLLIFPKIRAYIALASASTFVLLGILPIGKLFVTVDWNVLLMIAGTMGIVSLFIESKMPSLLGDLIIEKTPKERTVVKDFFPSVLLVGMVLLVILASFIPLLFGLLCSFRQI